jgi:hypothetical protein
VEDAAVAGVHWSEAMGLAGGANVLDGGSDGGANGADVGGFEAIGVEGDEIVVFWIEAEHLGGDVLEGVEEFCVVVEEEIGVRAATLYVEETAFETVWIDSACASCDAVFELKAATRGHQAHQLGYSFNSLLQIFHRHKTPFYLQKKQKYSIRSILTIKAPAPLKARRIVPKQKQTFQAKKFDFPDLFGA